MQKMNYDSSLNDTQHPYITNYGYIYCKSKKHTVFTVLHEN